MSIQVLLLMAGPSQSFIEAGFTYPKNLVEIDGAPLIQLTLESLSGLLASSRSLTCVLPKSEDRKHHTGAMIHLMHPKARLVAIEETAGAACSAVLAMSEIELDQPLVILNGDQIISAELNHICADFHEKGLDGGIVVFEAIHPRWSFVRCDEEGYVVEAAEKRPISNLATAGVYYFARAGDYLEAAKEMIKKDARVEGAFYICPVYNELILQQRRIGIAKIPKSTYWSLATPAGVKAYEQQRNTHSDNRLS